MMSSQDGTSDGAKKVHVAALGSSFAAGPGIPPQINRAAGRSGNNYPHILAKRLGAQLTDLTVSGATLKTILSEPQRSFLRGNRFEPQLKSLPSDADIVTITAGGNDLGYIGGVIHDASKSSLFGRLLSWLIPAPKEDVTAKDVAETFIAVVDEVRKIAPRSRVLLVEYLTLFGTDIKPGENTSLDKAQIRHHQGVAQTLEEAYKLVAEARPWCEIVPIGERSRGHGIGSEEPWVEGFSLAILSQGNVFHPNLKGMQAVADLIYEKLKVPGQ
jgi:lysophospholipase L1-like esterase